MDHIYSVFRQNSQLTTSNSNLSEWLSDARCLRSSISNGNCLAFTSTTDLHDTSGKTSTTHVYVIDLNAPHQPFKVTTHNEEITTLEWDMSGSKLLIGDVVGNVQVWMTKDYLLNEWTLVYSHEFPGERILSSVWFHNGIKIAINMDKKDSSVSYSDKYTYAKFGASVRQFGGRPSEGCLAISSSGLVCCLVFLSDGNVLSGTEILGQFRSKLKIVDICYAKNGDFLVVTTNGCVQSSINCYRVTVKVNCTGNIPQEKPKCSITCQSFSSFYPNCSTSNPTSEVYKNVTHLKFVLREAAEAVVIAVSGVSGSIVELFELREKSVTIHKMFPSTKNANDSKEPKTVLWQHHASSSSTNCVVSIATPRLSLFDISPPPSYILVAYKDNTLKCFYRENLQIVCSVNLGSAHIKTNDGTKSFGMHKSSSALSVSTIADMQFTWSSCAMVALDSCSQLFLYRLSPITDPGGPVSINFAQSMFEYCLVSGHDWWDIILNLRPNLIDSLCEKLTETFVHKQPAIIQQKWLSRFLTLKASLYRCLHTGSTTSSGQCKAGDCHTLLMLNSISTTLKSLLRPRDVQDKEGPAETLSTLMHTKGNEAQFINVDKVLKHLETKEFVVEPLVLQSLQHLNQWVSDISLYLLASLPQQCHNHNRFPGGGLIFDQKALNTLRELLVIVRVWGLINESCLPVFTKMHDNLDVISLLFKLLTKTVAANGSDPDEMLLDECCLLSNQVMIPQLDLSLKPIGVASPALFMQTLPLHFQYHVEPSFLKFNIKTHTIDGAVDCNMGRKVDVVRYVSLGAVTKESTNLRSCTRCNAMSLLKPIFRSPATRAWDQRWIKNCLCGGHWRVTNL